MLEKEYNELREKAEKLLEQGRPLMSVAQADDMDKALHELAVHQIELELQNEELRRTQSELEASLNKYSALFDLAPIGYFMLDSDAKIVEVNLTGCRQLDQERLHLLGKSFSLFIAPESQDSFYFHIRKVLDSALRESCELRIKKGDGEFFHAVLESLAIGEKARDKEAVRTVVADITELKHMHKEREKLIMDLQDALKKVKTLSGFLPICASCKKIRDDNGYWNQIETYIREHSEAEFTHAICPECTKKLYPEYYGLLNNNTEQP